MFKNYLKIALRNLRKQKLYSFINVFGLAVGIAFCALLFLYVQDELTFDDFHEKKDRIFRVYSISYEPDGSVRSTGGVYHPFLLGPALEADLPEIQRFVRLDDNPNFVRAGGEAFEENVLYADSTFFEVFTFPLQQGDPGTALNGLTSAVISIDAAHKYFGTADAVGKTLSIRLEDRFEDFTVTGVAENVPSNSSIRFDVVIPFANRVTSDLTDCATRWTCSFLFTYVELVPGASVQALETKMPEFWGKYHPDRDANLSEQGLSSYGFQPIQDVHLNPDFPHGLVAPSRPLYSYILAAIGMGVLLIACINFTTLAIGRSASRGKEIGVRKVVGANRAQLMRQFWGEALLLCLLGLLAGLVLAEAILPAFNTLTGKSLQLDYTGSWATIAALPVILLVTGLVAGSYPALVLSSFKPVDVLKNRLKLSGSNVLTRSMVVLQFALVIFLVMGTLIMLRQLDYVRSKDLGFTREQVVVVPLNGVSGQAALSYFRNELGERPEILGVTGASYSFGPSRGYAISGWTHEGVQHQYFRYDIESAFPTVMGLELLSGRNFNPELASDSSQAIIVNEAFVREVGMDDPIGRAVPGFPGEPAIIGVVRDFHFEPLHEQVKPAVLRLGRDLNYILVRVAPHDVPASLGLLQTAWQEVAPGLPFDYAFLDDDLNRFYESEQRWSRIIGYSAFFAILIACLGMFGLAALAVASRTKEIGVRRVLGASVHSLIVLLSAPFAGLVLIAIVLAAPAAYFAARTWLDNFSYRIEIGPGIFLLAGGLALAVALFTVSYQAIKAALADPVKSLRYE
jgi:putative ABC transport system permease protein